VNIRNPVYVAHDLADVERTAAFGCGPCKRCAKKARTL
jgi:hypothetical protein